MLLGCAQSHTLNCSRVDFATFVVSEEGRRGHELAMAWLYQEYAADRDGSLVGYEEALLILLETCQSVLGPRNRCGEHVHTHSVVDVEDAHLMVYKCILRVHSYSIYLLLV